MYGVRTADSMRTAQTIRKYSAWVSWCCLLPRVLGVELAPPDGRGWGDGAESVPGL